ncbi:MAG: cytochrome C [Gemmatimonadetes bacterium]|nr:MAG: cytochrome C [Gemmatimonadota bacterium]
MRRESSESPQKRIVNTKYRIIFIGICVILMTSAIYIIGESLQQEQQGAELKAPATGDIPSIPVEAGVFRRSEQALTYANAPENNKNPRTLDTFYDLRAYPGAPPVIPHELINEQSYGGKSCLPCHENGGYVPRFNAYAPVTPHPEMINCRQCHVAVKTKDTFKESNWVTIIPPPINQEAMTGSPPPIPHGLQMRENCLACHAGPAAPTEIRTSHPERINCRQCHALNDKPTTAWTRNTSY